MGGREHTTGQGYNKQFTKFMSRVVRLSYLQTIQILNDEHAVGDLVGETVGGSSSNSLSQDGKAGFLERTFGGVVGGILNSAANVGSFGLFGNPGSKRSKDWSISLNDSGWSVTRTWLEVYWDKARYAIGIRDIGVFNYSFSNQSELISKSFSSAKEIIKVQLQVDEQIPNVFPLDRRFIEYYITVDDGKNWHRINPLDHPTLYLDGQITPRTINFNIDLGGPLGDDTKNLITNEPVRSVRFRAVLFTDQGVDNASHYTPVLKKYRLKLYPRGGLVTDEQREV
jgi:hypothetical protein